MREIGEVLVADTPPEVQAEPAAFRLVAESGVGTDKTPVSWGELFSAEPGHTWRASARSELCGDTRIATLVWRDDRVALVLHEYTSFVEHEGGGVEHTHAARCAVYQRPRPDPTC